MLASVRAASMVGGRRRHLQQASLYQMIDSILRVILWDCLSPHRDLDQNARFPYPSLISAPRNSILKWPISVYFIEISLVALGKNAKQWNMLQTLQNNIYRHGQPDIILHARLLKRSIRDNYELLSGADRSDSSIFRHAPFLRPFKDNGHCQKNARIELACPTSKENYGAFKIISA